MWQSKKSPSELYYLADSFSVVRNNIVRLALPSDHSDTWTQDFELPSDITTGYISTAKIASAGLLQRGRGRDKAKHLGRTTHKKSLLSATVRLHASEPRQYITPTLWSNLDQQTPAILPKKISLQPRGIADPYGAVFITYTEPVRTYDIALLKGRRVAWDQFLYEDEVASPHNYPDPDTAIGLLTAMRDHIRRNGTLVSEQLGS